MDSRWVSGHSDKDGRARQVKGYRPILNDLKETLEKHFVKKPAVRDYGPGWEHKQIAVNEYNQALDDLLNFITVKED